MPAASPFFLLLNRDWLRETSRSVFPLSIFLVLWAHFATKFCPSFHNIRMWQAFIISSWKPAVSRALQRLVRAHARGTLLGAGITRKSGGRIVYKPQSKVFLWIFKTLKNSRSWFFFSSSVYKKKFSATKKLLVFVQKPVSVLAILYFNTFFFFLEKKKSCKDSIP